MVTKQPYQCLATVMLNVEHPTVNIGGTWACASLHVTRFSPIRKDDSRWSAPVLFRNCAARGLSFRTIVKNDDSIQAHQIRYT